MITYCYNKEFRNSNEFRNGDHFLASWVRNLLFSFLFIQYNVLINVARIFCSYYLTKLPACLTRKNNSSNTFMDDAIFSRMTN